MLQTRKLGISVSRVHFYAYGRYFWGPNSWFLRARIVRISEIMGPNHAYGRYFWSHFPSPDSRIRPDHSASVSCPWHESLRACGGVVLTTQIRSVGGVPREARGGTRIELGDIAYTRNSTFSRPYPSRYWGSGTLPPL